MSHRRGLLGLATITLALTAACGAAPAMTGAAAASPPDAQQAMVTITKQVPAAALGVVYTAANDPNHLLGRPTGYLSKVSFTDNRVQPGDVEGEQADAINRGGSVEVFADNPGAQRRKDYIQTITGSMPAFAEYDYVNGAVLVRVSRLLTPEQAGEYQKALADVG